MAVMGLETLAKDASPAGRGRDVDKEQAQE